MSVMPSLPNAAVIIKPETIVRGYECFVFASQGQDGTVYRVAA
jgi:hypothetical protein